MQENEHKEETLKKISGLYQDWFLDYASYVILDHTIPSVYDGFKPVQRRIMHSMRELEDGRYNKVANIVGNTMKYHPHGDASITDAMVQIVVYSFYTLYIRFQQRILIYQIVLFV